jgi:hypothetical protein
MPLISKPLLKRVALGSAKSIKDEIVLYFVLSCRQLHEDAMTAER